MSATTYGPGAYGTANETGNTIAIYTASVSFSGSVDEVWGEDHIGEEALLALVNEKAELSFEGLVSAADTTGATMKGVLQAVDIENSGIFATDSSVAQFYVTSVDLTRNNKGFETGSVTTVGRSALTDTTGTVVS